MWKNNNLIYYTTSLQENFELNITSQFVFFRNT